MLRSAGKLVNVAITAVRWTGMGLPSKKPFVNSPWLVRFYKSDGQDVDPVALQMINYAISHARTQRSDESYGQGLLILEQCLSANIRDGADNSTQNSRGAALLAMSTLLSERGDFGGAMEKLERIQELPHSSVGVRVAALEGLIGLNLEMGQDVTSSMLADKWLQLLKTNLGHGVNDGSHAFEVLQYRAKAIKGLAELILGNYEMAETCFGETQEDKTFSGNALLSHGEFLHGRGNFSSAKEFYQKVIQGVPETESFVDPSSVATCNMVSTEVLLGANCALGQLEAHSGNFTDAEEILTRALTKAEEHFGSHHPKVGVILTCIALMFRHKAKLERSSSILIQEGLYRRAIDLLKAPPLEAEGGEEKVERRDIVALAREIILMYHALEQEWY
ncbi:Tetratricopeptide repeat-containing domain [Macleaya cordata]|uniref:Tetratricopeptide repeat-containing domain n=1 Tax=Macleaya cordata TaxID=56857 RepID=A0A200R507_MACCD|nr:Tetratricopeptide repeat-containing domain [Macleaya cordata]